MRIKTALVLGNGLSGYASACLLARAGWRVVVAQPASNKALSSRYAHVHVVPEGVLRRLDRLTGAAQSWESVDALCLTTGGDRVLRPMALVAPDDARDALKTRADALGVEHAEVSKVIPCGNHWAFTAPNTRMRADLLIDASGTGQALARNPGVDIVQEEMAVRDVCHSWTGQAEGPADPLLMLARGVLGCDTVLARFADGRVRMTIRGLPVPPNADMLLDALMLASDAAWAQRMGGIRVSTTPVRYAAPLARLTEIENADALPPALLAGDALLQTAPRFGQGVAQMTMHLTALAAALDTGRSLRDLAAQLHQHAAAQWAGFAFTAAFPSSAQSIAA